MLQLLFSYFWPRVPAAHHAAQLAWVKHHAQVYRRRWCVLSALVWMADLYVLSHPHPLLAMLLALVGLCAGLTTLVFDHLVQQQRHEHGPTG